MTGPLIKFPAPPMPQMPKGPKFPPMFGQQPNQAAVKQGRQAQLASAAFGGSLLGSQLSPAQTGQKTLLGS